MYTCLINAFPLFSNFLLSALDEKKYGERLRWIDREAGLFALQWTRITRSSWRAEDFSVFADWDRSKGRSATDLKQNILQAKRRFDSILAKAMKEGCIRKLCSGTTRVFKLKKTCLREACCGPQAPIMTEAPIIKTEAPIMTDVEAAECLLQLRKTDQTY